MGKLLFGSVLEMYRGAKAIGDNPRLRNTAISGELLKEFESFVRSLGISDIGYTRVDPRYIFNGFRILYPNAIVFTMEMDRAKIKQAPSLATYIEVFRTYHQLGKIVNQAAEWFRHRGFNAHPGPAVGGDVNYIPIAIDAGLGVAGKNGLIITGNNGPRVRLAAVFTDIENLPFSTENPHQWVREYCETCNACVKSCPGEAIFQETGEHGDGGPVYIDYTRCAMPFSNLNGCSLCISRCPFSFSSYENLKEYHQSKDQKML